MKVEIPSQKMPAKDELVPVYLLQWATKDSLRRMADQGGAFITQDRLEKIVNAAKRDGFALGEQAGRYNLRCDIESGEVEPIRRVRDEP